VEDGCQAGGKSEFSKAEQETLGIIAFKQPIKQSVIIKIRGNKAYEHIQKFVDLNLIIKKKTGHTNELSLSDDFYDYFTLQTADEKPAVHLTGSNESENEAQESLKINNPEK
jgi:chromosome segregation and condensation protein ScpB